VTLVSISHITAAGHKAIFDGPSLKIFSSVRKLLGEIPVSKGLYHVEHTESAHTAMETVTVNDLHHWMVHMAPDAMKLLVNRGIVEGIHLDESQSIHTCNFCEFTNTSHKCEDVAEQTTISVLLMITPNSHYFTSSRPKTKLSSHIRSIGHGKRLSGTPLKSRFSALTEVGNT
jgi:hypothetical protein